MLQFPRDWLCNRNRFQRRPGRAEGELISVLMVRAVEGGQGLWGLKSSAPGFYLEIMELDCDWLEEVVAALS